MDKNGFTLVELIAVIAILALLLVLTTPAYENISNNIRQRNYDSKKSVIEKQTAEFVNKYMKDETLGKTICFTPQFLIRNGIVASDDENSDVIINDLNKTNFSNTDAIVSVSYDDNNRKIVARMKNNAGDNLGCTAYHTYN